MGSLIQRQDFPVRPNENEGPTILGATLTVTIAAFITLIARMYVRIKMIRNVGWDVSILFVDFDLDFMLTTPSGLRNDIIHGVGKSVKSLASKQC
jgi:hypothetical protein